MEVPRPVLALLAVLTLTALVLEVAAEDAPQLARGIALFVLTADLAALLALVFAPRRH